MPSASASLRMVEKWGSVTRFVSMLTRVLWEMPAALASCSWVMKFLRLRTLTLSPYPASFVTNFDALLRRSLFLLTLRRYTHRPAPLRSMVAAP